MCCKLIIFFSNVESKTFESVSGRGGDPPVKAEPVEEGSPRQDIKRSGV